MDQRGAIPYEEICMMMRRAALVFTLSTAALAAALGETAIFHSDPAAAKTPGASAAAATSQTFPDSAGQSTTISTTGAVAVTHPFFANLGKNGRACVTCHQPQSGWSITPQDVRARFKSTNGLDPIFRTVDGSNSPNAPVTTPAQRMTAYSMLLNHGVIRIGLPVPAGAEFTLTAVDDPYHFASATQLSLFRRPLPATNLKFASTIMWDGRQTGNGVSVNVDLHNQAVDAVIQHEQGAAPNSTAVNQIVAFESGLYSAQSGDNIAGLLDSTGGAGGGPLLLSQQAFFPGINDPQGGNPPGSTFNPRVFTLYGQWAAPVPPPPGGPRPAPPTAATLQRQSIARGEALFNSRPLTIANVPGFNDVVRRPIVNGTCSSCHSAPNAGSRSLPVFMDLGLTNPPRRTPDLPLYTFKNRTTGEVRQTTDPGRALITGKWSDMARFKVPTLRDLPARAPYFHNGSAASTADVINFYNTRFRMNLTPQERADLKSFLDSI